MTTTLCGVLYLLSYPVIQAYISTISTISTISSISSISVLHSSIGGYSGSAVTCNVDVVRQWIKEHDVTQRLHVIDMIMTRVLCTCTIGELIVRDIQNEQRVIRALIEHVDRCTARRDSMWFFREWRSDCMYHVYHDLVRSFRLIHSKIVSLYMLSDPPNLMIVNTLQSSSNESLSPSTLTETNKNVILV